MHPFLLCRILHFTIMKRRQIMHCCIFLFPLPSSGSTHPMSSIATIYLPLVKVMSDICRCNANLHTCLILHVKCQLLRINPYASSPYLSQPTESMSRNYRRFRQSYKTWMIFFIFFSLLTSVLCGTQAPWPVSVALSYFHSWLICAVISAFSHLSCTWCMPFVFFSLLTSVCVAFRLLFCFLCLHLPHLFLVFSTLTSVLIDILSYYHSWVIRAVISLSVLPSLSSLPSFVLFLAFSTLTSVLIDIISYYHS